MDAEEDPASEGRAATTKVSRCESARIAGELAPRSRKERGPRHRISPARRCRRRSSSRVKGAARAPQASAARCPTRERRGLVALRSARGSVKVAEALCVARAIVRLDRLCAPGPIGARLVPVDSSAARETRQEWKASGVESPGATVHAARRSSARSSRYMRARGSSRSLAARANQGRQRYAVRRHAEEMPRSAKLLKGSARTAEAGCRR